MKYRSEIDGLRAFAVVPVILFHAGFQVFSGGYVGVDVFFVISAYLITTMILSEMEAGTFSIAAFYERRARRILPVLFFVLLATLPFALLWLMPREMKDYAKSLIAVPLFLSNVLFWRQSGYFDTGVDAKPLIHTWSLAVEEQFYILFPLLLMVLWRGGRTRLTAVLTLIGVCSLAVAQLFAKSHPDAGFYLLHTRAWELIVGALAALYAMRRQPVALNLHLKGALSVAGLLMIAAAVFGFSRSTPFPGVYALLPTLGAALVIVFASPDNLAGRVLGSRPLVGIGLISYSAYLWHQPLFAFARVGYGIKNGSAAFVPLIAATLVLAYFSWRFVERPFRQQARFQRRTIFASSLAASMLVLCVGIVGDRTGGGFFRYEPEAMAVLGYMEERGNYVWANANTMKLKSFEADKRKILVIGDSMGADVVNAVYETPYRDRLSMSFFTIDYPCGNLYLPENFIDKIGAEHRQTCLNVGWYANPKLRQLIKEADQVWLVSVWATWQIERLDQSLHNLNAEFGDKFVVFSRKSFGKISLQDLSELSLAQRRRYRSAPVDYVTQVNTELSTLVPADHYFDLSRLICSANTCHNFDESGELLSFDGDHLTRSGARYLGKRLAREPRFVHALLGVK